MLFSVKFTPDGKIVRYNGRGAYNVGRAGGITWAARLVIASALLFPLVYWHQFFGGITFGQSGRFLIAAYLGLGAAVAIGAGFMSVFFMIFDGEQTVEIKRGNYWALCRLVGFMTVVFLLLVWISFATERWIFAYIFSVFALTTVVSSLAIKPNP